jgi:hypothetical protein
VIGRSLCTGALTLVLAVMAGPADAERLVLVSDLNGRYGSTTYHDRVERAASVIVGEAPDLVISTGDMVAGQLPAGFGDENHEAMWAAFRQSFAEPLAAAGIPMAVTAGNHDGSAFPGFEADRAHFEDHWQNSEPPPGLLPGSEWPWRYALHSDGLLLITFDGTLPGRVPERERAFVADMLISHGADAEWTLVFSHLPFWPLARGREREILDDDEFLGLMHEHGVDVYASGHHHVHYAGLDDHGMLHLAVGALGGNARKFAAGGERQPHAFAEIERVGGSLTVRGRPAPFFDGVIEPGGLPDAVAGPAGRLRRVDGPVPLRE